MNWQKTRRDYYFIKAIGTGTNVLEERIRQTLGGALLESRLMYKRHPKNVKVMIFTFTGLAMEVGENIKCVLKRGGEKCLKG